MGADCSACNCSDASADVATVQIQEGSNKRSELKIKHVIRLQAWFRGNRTRKQLANAQVYQKITGIKKYTEEKKVFAPKNVNGGPDQVEKRPEFTFKNGAIYDGEWLCDVEDVRHGMGKQVWPDGARYEGMWKYNKANGRGTFWHVHGDIYKGDWVDDKAQGKGVYTHANGAKYDGEWENDLQHGYGVEVWADNSKYEGMYQNGRKHGRGKYYWTDGSRYTGDWFENKINGQGRYEWVDGRVFEGGWIENNMDGHGVYTWADGRKYEGAYSKDRKHGFGKYTWADGRRYEGMWLNGRQHGQGIYCAGKNEPPRTGLWVDGKREKWV